MEAKTQRILKSGRQYDHLFPKALFTETTIKKNAFVDDTVKFIPQVVAKTRWQVEDFVKQELTHLSITDACEKLWHFVKDHIEYKKDESGKEQVRSPRNLWWGKIGDCDCFTTFISACLSAMPSPKKILHRITKYSQDHFQHIYPVVITPEGKQIIMDCVVEEYDYEEPYTEKKDFIMELTYLDGVPNKNMDTEMLDETNDLGKLFDFLKKKTDPATGEKKPGILKQIVTKGKEVLKKGLNVINKVNPATVLLRAGVLAAMKLNIMKVPQRLKYAYLSDAEAQKRGVDMVKFQKLKTVKDKLEKIFYGAGGKPENLKEAILKGKGNENHEVPLSGFDRGFDIAVSGMSTGTPLAQVIGQEVYYSEFMKNGEEVEGLGSLGEPATATAIAAASGVMAAIAALLKNIGNIFNLKNKASADFENTDAADKEAEKVNTSPDQADLDKLTTELTDQSNQETQQNQNIQTRSVTIGPDDTPPETTDTTTNKTTDPPPPPPASGFWETHKKWLKPTLIATGSVITLGGLYLILKPKTPKPKKEVSFSGLNSKKKKKKSAKQEKIKTVKLK